MVEGLLRDWRLENGSVWQSFEGYGLHVDLGFSRQGSAFSSGSLS